MITFDFDKNLEPCTSCKAFCGINISDPHCLVGYPILFNKSYFPVYSCNRPIDASELLDLLNSLFLRDN